MNRFDLDKAVAAWRRTLEHTRGVSPEDLRELECHVRDQVEWLRAEGLAEEAAFRAALRDAGDFGTTEAEYEKVYWRKQRHRGRLRVALLVEIDMLKSYLVLAWRNLGRQPGYAFLNVAGLAAGLACCLLIALYVRGELSYDRHHPDADRLYRVVVERERGDDVRRMANAAVPLGPTLEAEVAGIEEAVRFWRAFQPVVHYEDRHVREEGFYFTDPDAFDVFSFDFLAGDPATALAAPGTVVVTETTARRYFDLTGGVGDALGRVLRVEGYPIGEADLTVTGVLRDLPPHTQFDFSFLASTAGIEREADNFGSFKPIWTYVRLAPGTTPEGLAAPLAAFADRHVHTVIESNARYTFFLEPLTHVHLHTDAGGGFKPASSIRYVYLFAAIGLFILLLAAINFTNLATARSLRRAREVGLRKVLGAHRVQLTGQFLGEAFLLTGLAVGAAVGLAYLLLPAFNAVAGKALALDFPGDGFTVGALLGLALVVALMAGSYPALFLSGFRPLAALRGEATGLRRGAALRKGLVVFQFAVTCVLMIATMVVHRQLDYVRSQPLGFDEEHVVVLPYSPAADAVTARLRQDPRVLAASVSQRVPALDRNFDGRPVLPEGADEPVQVESFVVDEHFVSAFGMEVVAGRSFTDRPADAGVFVLNEAAVKAFGWTSAEAALGKTVGWGVDQKVGPVVGVVRDFQTASMHGPVPPVVLQLMPESQWWRTFLSVRIRPDDVPATLAFLEDTWRRATPGGAYDYFFLDDAYDAQYRSDERFGRLFRYFAALAIVIACLGLFGLAAYSAEQRTKEIGVRKVFGATVPGLVLLLVRDFVALVGAAFVLAAPVAYLAMERWLAGFAFRTALSWKIFAAVGLAALVVALVTVGYQALRAATTDPVKALRYE